jgi:MFS superfamily sulfate permease-like transporter
MVKELPLKGQLLNPEVSLIAACGLLIVMAFNQLKGPAKRFIPVPLLVVASGVFLARFFDFEHVHTIQSHGMIFDISPKLLLAIPTQIASTIVTPDFSAISSGQFWIHTLSISLVASIESLLSAAAVDKLDPMRRQSDMNKELVSKGLCNMILGTIGGLPIIAEMVRSKANVQNGAQTKAANFIHGFAILIFAVVAPSLLNNIPLATFAAVLIPVGYALAHPSQFFHTAKAGKEHFSAFLVTLVVTLASDLLLGVAAGLFTEMLWNLYHGMSPLKIFSIAVDSKPHNDAVALSISSPLTFTNLIPLTQKIHGTHSDKNIIIDVTKSPYVDYTAFEHLARLSADSAVKGRTIEIKFNPTSRYHNHHSIEPNSSARAATSAH